MVHDWKPTLMKSASYILAVLSISCHVSVAGFNLNGIEKGHFRDFTYKTISPTGLSWCARYCVLQKQCQSFNFLKPQLLCELNLEEKTAVAVKFDADVEGSYYGAASDFYGDVSLAGACATHSCKEGETCIHLRNSNFKCVKTECDGTPVLENANSFSGNDYQYIVGTQLNFTCNSGYVTNGSLTATCQPDITWSPVSPCKDCGDPPTIPSGQAGAGTNTIGSSRDYSCNSGYAGFGTDTITCLSNATWSITDYECRDCGDPPTIPSGQTNAGTNTIGSLRDYSCNFGYTGFGTNQIACLSNATWSTTDYECKGDCGDPPTIPSGQTNAGTNTVGSSRNYSCNFGYTGFGTNQITCLSNATWSTTDYECKEDCGDPPTIPSGQTNAGTNTVGSSRNYSCNFGYTGFGTNQITCLSNATWSTTDYECKEDCGDPPTIPSGQTNAGTNTIGSLRDYSCNLGYTGFGANQITCLSNATWSTTDYECKEDCKNPPNIADATPDSSSAAVGSYVTYTCDTGYTIATVNGVLCGSDGSWQGASFVQCNGIDCGTPPSPANTEPLGTYQTTSGSSITYVCKAGKSNRWTFYYHYMSK